MNPTPNIPPLIEEVIFAAEALVCNTVPVVLIRPRSKMPIPSPANNGWLVIDDPDAVRAEVMAATGKYGVPNLAVLSGRQKNSPLITLDVDGASGMDQARRLGVSRNDACWIERTGSGNYAAFFHAGDAPDLPRVVKAGGVDLDLITNGYQLVPPSVTKSKYVWLEEHSPSEIPFGDLTDLPDAVIQYWLDLRPVDKRMAPELYANEYSGVLTSIGRTIYEGSRNDNLFRVGCYLQQFLPKEWVQILLHNTNIARCVPPLSLDEVVSIAGSVQRYPQDGINGFPNAVVPSFFRKTADA
jgi:hypothetical protein